MASPFQQVDVDDTLSMYESALRRHFPQRDGWILTRNYPFHVFAESFYVEEPTDSIPLEEELDPSCVDPASRQRPDLSTLALVIEHVSCPGEPVLILDMHDTPEPRLLDDLSDSTKYRNAVLLDIMGWQLNDVERGFVITAHGTSWSGASIRRSGKARSASTKAFFNPSFDTELDESGLAWIDWAQSGIRQTSNSMRHKTVFEDVRNVKSHKAFATMAALIEDGLPPYDETECDTNPWIGIFDPLSSGSSSEDDIWDSLKNVAAFGGLNINLSATSNWSSSDEDDCRIP